MNISLISLFYSSISNDYLLVVFLDGNPVEALLCFIVLYFVALYRYWVFFFFNKLKVYGNLVSSKAINAIFPTAFAHFVSLSHFGNS